MSCLITSSSGLRSVCARIDDCTGYMLARNIMKVLRSLSILVIDCVGAAYATRTNCYFPCPTLPSFYCRKKTSSSKKGTLLNWFSASPSKTKRSLQMEEEEEKPSSHKRLKGEEAWPSCHDTFTQSLAIYSPCITDCAPYSVHHKSSCRLYSGFYLFVRPFISLLHVTKDISRGLITNFTVMK